MTTAKLHIIHSLTTLLSNLHIYKLYWQQLGATSQQLVLAIVFLLVSVGCICGWPTSTCWKLAVCRPITIFFVFSVQYFYFLGHLLVRAWPSLMSCQHCIIVCFYSAKFVVVDNKFIHSFICLAGISVWLPGSRLSTRLWRYSLHDGTTLDKWCGKVEFMPGRRPGRYHVVSRIDRRAVMWQRHLYQDQETTWKSQLIYMTGK